ncbi:MAG: type II toxin-antitoxin system HicA family toxin [Elusimicrobia bacterium]|nr:type II toxin-antitoxin system HicA family toxin [Elusimicrobiota bacterium]
MSERLIPQSAKTLVKIFEKFGYVVSKRRSGDHIAMRKEGAIRPLIIPDKREIPVFIIKNNLRSAGITREEYLAALKDL